MEGDKKVLIEQEITQLEQDIVTIKEELATIQEQLGTGEQEFTEEVDTQPAPELDEQTRLELEARELELIQELTAKQMKLTALKKQLADLTSGEGLATYYEGGN